MNNKLFVFAAAVLLSMSYAYSAYAAFGNLELVRVVFNQTGGITEIGTDLGNVNTALAGGSFGDGASAFTAQAGGTDFSNLNVAYFAVNTTTRELWLTGLDPQNLAGKSATVTGLTTNIFTYYNSLAATGSTVAADASYFNSYRVKADQTTNFGAFGTFITYATQVNTEASLAALSGGGSVTQNLYHFASYAVASPASNPTLVATITTKPDGSTYIAPISTKSDQTIGAVTFTPATIAVGGTTTASATATSGLPVSFSSTTPAICTISGATITGVASGTCGITGSQPGNSTYNAAAPVNQNITVLTPQAIGTISFSPPNLTVNSTTTASAVTNSNLTINFGSATPSICTASGSIVTGVAEGLCTITADQAGDATFAPAPQVTQNITVIAPIIKIDSSMVPLNTLGAALAAPIADASILLQAAPVFVEKVVMDNPVTILLDGGYTDAAFTNRTSNTTINGSLTIKRGTLKIRNIIVM